MSGSSVTTLRTRSSWRTGSSWRRHRLSRRSPCSLCRVGTTWCARWSLPGSCTRHCPTATSRSSPTPGTQWGRSALQRGWSKYQMILPKLVEPIHRELLWLHAFLAWQNVDGLENICNTNVYFYILLYFALIIMYKCWFLVKKSFCSWQYSQWGDYILWFRTSFFNVGFLCVQKKFIRTWAYSSHKNMSIFLPQEHEHIPPTNFIWSEEIIPFSICSGSITSKQWKIQGEGHNKMYNCVMIRMYVIVS